MVTSRHLRHARRALLVVLVLGGVALVSGTSADSRTQSRAEPASGRDCPRGQAAVILAGARACRPLGAALPRPRRGDERLAVLRQLFTSAWGSPPDLKGRRPPTIEQLVSVFGPTASARLRKAIMEIPATLDRLDPTRKPGTVGSPAAAGCGPPRGSPKITSTKRENLGNGSAFDVTFNLGGGQATASLGFEGKAKDGSDRTLRMEAVFDLCDENVDLAIPACPTADGSIDGSGKSSYTVKVASLKDGKAEHSATVEIRHQVKTFGTVAVDAKLDRVRIDDVYNHTLRTTGSSILWGPASERGTVTRSAWVDMRTGKYDLGQANVVDVQVAYTGILSLFVQDALAKQRVAGELKKKSDETFSRTLKHAIDEYREREQAWQTPNTCASLDFTPASHTLRLRNGQTGSLQGAVKASRGGVAKDGRWRRGAQRNVSVTPAQASGAQPTFTYRVTNADRVVSASFRATSPAGVAAGDWVQGGEELPLRFSGTFTGENRTAGTNRYSGTITFVRNATSSAGNVTYRVERVSWKHLFTSETPCKANASTTVSIAKPDPQTSGLTIVKGKEARGHRYAITAFFVSPKPLTITVTCNGVQTTQPWVPGAALNTSSDQYTDGKTIKGRYESTGTLSTYTWNLKGSG